MVDLVGTVIVAAALYLAPGYAALELANLQGAGRLTRFFLSLCVSLVLVPYVFQAVGLVFPFIPGLIPLAALVLVLLAAGWLLEYLHLRPSIRLGDEQGSQKKSSLGEQAFVVIFIALFSGVALLPRLDMLLNGFQAQFVAPADETWHLAQLISVARTGIPAQHYFFPTLRLSYYYASWIYPAIVGNLPIIQVSLARAMALHAYLQVFAFLGAVYCYLNLNQKAWWARLAGLSFFTLMGGFDLYTSISTPNLADWWQTTAGWLVSNNQISQFVTLYDWVPQHLAGGMAFILALIAWKDLHSSVRLKILLSALLLAFCFTTSPFVFLAFLIAAGLFGLFHSRSVVETLRRNPKPILLYTGIAALLFLLASWSTITGISGRSSSLALNDLRVPIVGFLLGENPKSAIIDHLLTILGFPLVAFWIGLIEFGLPFILFLAWIIKKVSSGRRLFADGFDFVTIVFPPLYLLLTFVLRDSGGGGNFSMRGMIPAQILINFGALKVLEAPRSGLPQPAWKRWGLVYLFACFLVAQGVSAYAEVRGDSLNTIKQVEQTGIGKTTQKKTPLGYIAWLNANTPRDALILEDGCPPAGNTGSYRRLERSRFISPVCSETISQFNRDADFIVNDEWRRLSQNAETAVDILDLYQASSFWLKGKGPLFLVSWGNNPKWARLGEAMYRDAYVSIYQVPATPGK